MSFRFLLVPDSAAKNRPFRQRASSLKHWRVFTGPVLGSAIALTSLPSAGQETVHLGATIIQDSACVGFDCVSGESFGFDTLRLKENNLRIHIDDTSATAGFPANDWRLIFNDTASGGGNYFAVEDSTNTKTPFRVEAGAPSNSLTVDSAGELGLGTLTPATNIHSVDGNTPTLRLEQDGSSGFSPQTWDVAGNEAGFFIRDVTNGSNLSFRVIPNSPGDGFRIEPNKVLIKNQVEIGTSTANQTLTVYGEVNVVSDERLKMGAQYIAGALDILSAIQGKQFSWKSQVARGADNPTYGFMAQEIERVAPSLVRKTSDGTKSVNYLGLIPVLVNALNEQNAVVQRQQQQIEEMKVQVDRQSQLLSEFLDAEHRD